MSRIHDARQNGIRFEIAVHGDGSEFDAFRPKRQDLDMSAAYVLADTYSIGGAQDTVEMWADKAKTDSKTLDKIRNADNPVLRFIEETGK